MNLKEIIEAHLKDNGFSGLYCVEWECGCRLGDLFPCGAPHLLYCIPGILRPADPENTESGFGWIVGPKEESSHDEPEGVGG
jgi:hypothetical protein